MKVKNHKKSPLEKKSKSFAGRLSLYFGRKDSAQEILETGGDDVEILHSSKGKKKLFGRRMTRNKSEPDLNRLERVSKSERKTHPQFAISVDELFKLYPAKNKLPTIPVVVLCTNHLLSTLKTEGLFRISGNYEHISQLKNQFEKGNFFLPNEPHTVAGLLKLFFRELKESVFTFDLFNDFLDAAKLPQEEAKKTIKYLLEKLPYENRCLLKYITFFLFQVVSTPENRMTGQAIGRVFGSTLLFSSKETMPSLDDFLQIEQQCLIVQYIISDPEYFWCEEKAKDDNQWKINERKKGKTYVWRTNPYSPSLPIRPRAISFQSFTKTTFKKNDI